MQINQFLTLCPPILNSPFVYSCPAGNGLSYVNGSYVKLNGAGDGVVNGETTDIAAQVLGIVLGITGVRAVVQTQGAVTLNFDGPTVSGNAITLSTTIAGYFHDTGSTTQSSTTLGVVTQTLDSAGQATAFLGMSAPIAGGGGGGVSSFNGRTGAVVPQVGDYSMSDNPPTFELSINTPSPTASSRGVLGVSDSTAGVALTGIIKDSGGTESMVWVGPTGDTTAINFGVVASGAYAELIFTPLIFPVVAAPACFSFPTLPSGILAFATSLEDGTFSVRVVNFSGAPVDLSVVIFVWSYLSIFPAVM